MKKILLLVLPLTLFACGEDEIRFEDEQYPDLLKVTMEGACLVYIEEEHFNRSAEFTVIESQTNRYDGVQLPVYVEGSVRTKGNALGEPFKLTCWVLRDSLDVSSIEIHEN